MEKVVYFQGEFFFFFFSCHFSAVGVNIEWPLEELQVEVTHIGFDIHLSGLFSQKTNENSVEDQIISTVSCETQLVS